MPDLRSIDWLNQGVADLGHWHRTLIKIHGVIEPCWRDATFDHESVKEKGNGKGEKTVGLCSWKYYIAKSVMGAITEAV